jgi:hypothetical protein
MDLPLTTFTGHLKRLNLSTLDSDARLVFNFAVPGFSSTPTTNLPPQAHALGVGVTEITDAIYGKANRRRYAPGATMDSGRYYSVAKSAGGDDGGTMRDEIAAYRDPAVTGHCAVLDHGRVEDLRSTALFNETVDGQRRLDMILDPNDSKLSIYAYSERRLLAELGPATTERMRKCYACDESQFLVGKGLRWRDPVAGEIKPCLALSLDWDHSHDTIDRVLDLRQRDTQRWFADKFASGIPGLTRLPLPPGEFLNLTGRLMNPRLGGGFYTTAVGLWAVRNSIAGIIYPSARSDVRVLWDEHGNLLDWGGWSFVDLRDKAESRMADHFDHYAGLRGNIRHESWMQDEEFVDLGQELMFMQHTMNIKVPNGFEVEQVRTLNDKLHHDNYAGLKSRWRADILPLDSEDERVLKHLQLLIFVEQEQYTERHEARLLAAENSHHRRSLDVCDCCNIELAMAEANFALGRYLYLSPFRDVLESRFQEALGIERGRSMVEKEFAENDTIFALCAGCTDAYIAPADQEIGREAARAWVNGADVQAGALATAPSQH